MNFIRLFLVALGTLPAFAGPVSAEPHLYFGCEIYDIKDTSKPKLVRKFPGELCLFLNDGSVVQSLPDRVAKHDAHMKELWSLPTKAHHQINLSPDGRHILIIGSEAVLPDRKYGNARSDVLFVVDQKGKIQKRFSFYDNRKQFNQAAWKNAVERRFPMIWNLARFKEVKWEITHANSFYEIEAHTAEKTNPEFKKGHYIVNDVSLMMAFVLDHKLKKVVWQKSLRPEIWNMTHDVQVLPNGRLLYYDNGTKEKPQSSLRETDLATGKDEWTYLGQDGVRFFSNRWGGVQRLADGGTLYTDITTRPEIIEIDPSGKKRWSWYPGDGKYLQQARKVDLTEFLKNNKAL
ncbi:MAG: arylsulfotransferase family protein [Bdellovibrionales bacterium]|nr:arylsulfotransferase family protein [Bdellovibrionales bacterium]